MWILYRVEKWLYGRLAEKFDPAIPQQLLNLGKRFKLDLGYVRFMGKKLSVEQVDEMLNACFPLVGQHDSNTAQTRMFTKNLLVEFKLMSLGAMEVDLVHEYKHGLKQIVPVQEKNLWNKGKPLQKPKKSWNWRTDLKDWWLVVKFQCSEKVRKIRARIFNHKAA